MLLAEQHGLGVIELFWIDGSSLQGKKLFASASPFSTFVVAFFFIPSVLNVSVGILLLPPSNAFEDISLLTVHMSGSSALSSQSLQCCFFVASRVLWYTVV